MRPARAKGQEEVVKLVIAEEYLALEREAEERHKWLDGLIYAMAGEILAHSIICSIVNAEVNIQLRGKPCTFFSPNRKTRAQRLSAGCEKPASNPTLQPQAAPALGVRHRNKAQRQHCHRVNQMQTQAGGRL